jgi:hypothetical protein
LKNPMLILLGLMQQLVLVVVVAGNTFNTNPDLTTPHNQYPNQSKSNIVLHSLCLPYDMSPILDLFRTLK